MAYSIGEAYISLRADYLKVFSDIAQMKVDLIGKLGDIEKTTTTILSKAGEKAGKTFWQKLAGGGGALDVAKGLGIATGVQGIVSGIKGAIGGAIKSFMDFEFEMASVKAKANATAIEFRALEEAARDMGRTTFYNAIEAAQGLKVLVEMGLTATESITALPKVLTLATTEGMNLADAADIALGSMRGMAMATTDLDRIVDGLAYTAAKSASTVYSLGQGLKVAGAAAHLSGQSLEDVLAVLGGLSNQMIRSETAGFAITQMMARLTRVASTLKGTVDETGSTLGMARETMRGLDIELTKDGKTLKALPEIFTAFRDKTISTLEALRIFGVYTYKYALAAVNATDATNKLKSSLTEVGGEATGAGDRMAAIKLDTLKADVKLAANAVVDLGIELGKVFSPAATIAVQVFTAAVKELSTVISGTKPLSVFEEDKPIETRGRTLGGGMTTQVIPLVPTKEGVQARKEFIEKSKQIFNDFWSFIKAGVKDINEHWNVRIVDEAKIKQDSLKVYTDIINKFSVIKYNKYGLPILGKPKILQITEEDRMLMEDLKRASEAESKVMDQLYSKQKVMSFTNLKHQLANIEEYNSKAESAINNRYDKEVLVLKDVENIRKQNNETDLAGTIELTKQIIALEFSRVQKLGEVRKLTSSLEIEQIAKFEESNNKSRLEEANKAAQNNARIAESFTRLASGMKENSKEYFDWKVKALDAQRIKELAIVEDTEEGKYLTEKWYEEQRKQLHYVEVERSKDLFGGAKVGFSKLADEGAMFGQIGEDWVYDLKSGFQSGFSTFFSDTLKGTKSWGESIKGLFTDIIGNILDLFAKAASQLLANSLFNLLLGSFVSVGTSGVSNIPHTSKAFDTSNLTKFPDFSDPRPYVKLPKIPSKLPSDDNMIVNQSFNVNVTANDAQSVHQFFRRNGKIVQELAAQGVDKSRRLKKAYRGNNE